VLFDGVTSGLDEVAVTVDAVCATVGAALVDAFAAAVVDAVVRTTAGTAEGVAAEPSRPMSTALTSSTSSIVVDDLSRTRSS
jgi:hypothetical protein